MTLPKIFLNGIGTIGPGFGDWPTLAGMLRGEIPWVHIPTQAAAPQALPAAERRRVGMSVRLALATGFEACRHAQADPAHLGTIFTSSSGDGEICHILCETLASEERQISPTRFHNSVHNASSGYWSIATGCMSASTSLCGRDASFAAGIIEAVAQLATIGEDVLLIACDTPYPEPLQSCRPLLDSMGVGLILSAHQHQHSIAALHVDMVKADITPCPVDAMKPLQLGIPAARGLPMLSAVAQQKSGRIHLEYLDHLTLSIDVAICN